MNRILRSSLPIFMAALLILAITNCGADKEEVKVPESVPETEPTVADYLGEGVVLARFIWEDFFEATFFPANILTEANDETKGEYEVVSLAGSPDVTKGAKKWTKDVILKSHPAEKEELKVGIVVLYTGGEVAKDDEGLRYSRWSRGVILKTDELNKNIVSLKGGIYRRTYEVHIRNIRISDDPVIKAPKEE